jgi:hypothetical protein
VNAGQNVKKSRGRAIRSSKDNGTEERGEAMETLWPASIPLVEVLVRDGDIESSGGSGFGSVESHSHMRETSTHGPFSSQLKATSAALLMDCPKCHRLCCHMTNLACYDCRETSGYIVWSSHLAYLSPQKPHLNYLKHRVTRDMIGLTQCAESFSHRHISRAKLPCQLTHLPRLASRNVFRAI